MDDLYLFGGTHPWVTSLWEATDDRVRGGASKSHLFVLNPEHARFYGHLDISTLGGAGFASQNSIGELNRDLSAYEGIVIRVVKSDGKKYIITLKDEIPGRRKDGRKRSGVSWEASFSIPASSNESQDVFLPWSEFEATYRGRKKPDAKPLDLKNIQRISLMMRSFFGEQEGDFSIDLHSIAARRKWPDEVHGESCQQHHVSSGVLEESESDDETDVDDLGKSSTLARSPSDPPRQRWWTKLTCGLI